MLPEAHDASAGNLLYRGKIRASLDGYLTAYELDPANGRAAARLGYAYHLLGRPDLSILWYRKATRRETRPVYADNIGDAWTDLQDYDKAEEAYRMAAIFRPDLPAGDLGLSRVAMLRGDYNAARAECRETRVKYQGNPQPLMMAAQIEFFSRDFDTAEKFYREASAADHAGGVAYYGAVRFLSAMGFARQHSGAEEEGKALLEEAVALDKEELSAAPDNPSRLYSLAADYAALGNREAAITTLERAAEAGWIDCCSMSLDPRFDSILSEPRFTNALENMSARVNSFHSLLLTEN
jgi:tetratricopeptide (TPR) repeat protein